MLKKLSEKFLKQSFFFSTSSSNLSKSIALEEKYGCHNYHPIPVVLTKGEGIYLYDEDGKKYMDFLAAYSAVNQGHCHPKIKETMIEQLNFLTLSSRAFYTDKLGPLEEYLTSTFSYDKVLLMNTGVEAGESAIKFARRWAYETKMIPDNQAKILFAKGNFWGRTIAACGSSDDPDRFYKFGPFGGLGFELIEYEDEVMLEQRLKNDKTIAAYMLEPIQGERGVVIPKPGYLPKVRELCTKYNVLMIADEVQTGLGRTGKMLGCEWENIRPDILLLGKALTGGFYPVSAVLCDNYIMNLIKAGQHGSTYGGNPLGAAVAKTALQVLIEEGMIENSRKMGELLLKGLQEIKKEYKSVKDVRGRGLMCALEFDKESKASAWDVCLKMKENGVLAKPTHSTTIRLTPPLVITEKQIEEALNKIRLSLNNFK